jgi:hypothetical protein
MLGAATLGLAAGNNSVTFTYVGAVSWGSGSVTIPGQTGDILIGYSGYTGVNYPTVFNNPTGYTEMFLYQFGDVNGFRGQRGFYKIRAATELSSTIDSSVNGFKTVICYRPTSTLTSVLSGGFTTSGNNGGAIPSRTLSFPSASSTYSYIGLAQGYSSLTLASSAATPTRSITGTMPIQMFEYQGGTRFPTTTISTTATFGMLSAGWLAIE